MNAGIYTFRNRSGKSAGFKSYTAPLVRREPYAAPEIVLPKVNAPLALPTHKGNADIRTDNAPEIERMRTLARFYWTSGAIVLSDRYTLCADALAAAPVTGFAPYHAALADLVPERRNLKIA